MVSTTSLLPRPPCIDPVPPTMTASGAATLSMPVDVDCARGSGFVRTRAKLTDKTLATQSRVAGPPAVLVTRGLGLAVRPSQRISRRGPGAGSVLAVGISGAYRAGIPRQFEARGLGGQVHLWPDGACTAVNCLVLRIQRKVSQARLAAPARAQ